MKMKFLYDILISPLGLPISPIAEYIILLVIGEIVHEIAWSVSPGGRIGSIIYWITKLIVFVVVWAILYLGIVLIKSIYIHCVLALLILGGILVLLTILIIVNKVKKRKR